MGIELKPRAGLEKNTDAMRNGTSCYSNGSKGPHSRRRTD